MYDQNAKAETEEKTILLHRDQDRFIFDNWKYGWYTGEIGNGKTLAGVYRAERLSYEYPKNAGMVLRKYWKDNRDTTLEQFHDLLPSYKKYYKLSTATHEFPNGSIIFWRGMDRLGKVDDLLNYNLGWFWLEQGEQLWYEIMYTLQGRLRKEGMPLTGWITSNPAGHNWVWELFHPDSAKRKKGYLFIQPPVRWNKQNLPEDYYEEKERDWPKPMIDRFLNGLHEGYEGLLYYCLTDENDTKQTEFNGGTMWEFQDYGVSQSNPMVLLNIHVTIDGKISVFNEFYKYGCMPEELVSYIKTKREIYKTHDRLVKSIACPATFQTESDGDCPAEKFKKYHGIFFEPNPCKFETRYPILFKLINTKQLKINFDNCPHLVSELRSLTWQNIKTSDDHAIEALERGCEYLDKYLNKASNSQTEEVGEAIDEGYVMETAGLWRERF